jgi:hypothetical protein
MGTQNYVCLPSATSESGFVWDPTGPQATLFTAYGRQTMTHFLSPNPDEHGAPRATWQHSQDTSSVWAKKIEESEDSAFVEPGAIPWLLLEVVGAEDGRTGSHRISRAAYLQRINTSGGSPPETGCDEGTVGKKIMVPYAADYLFYKPSSGN